MHEAHAAVPSANRAPDLVKTPGRGFADVQAGDVRVSDSLGS
jgi:hypothetical protein